MRGDGVSEKDQEPLTYLKSKKSNPKGGDVERGPILFG
jgi:hypothetical protein